MCRGQQGHALLPGLSLLSSIYMVHLCRPPRASTLPSSSQPVAEATQFAARLDSMMQSQATNRAAAQQPPVQLPAGCNWQGSAVLVRQDAPAIDTLQLAVRLTKKGKRGCSLPEAFQVKSVKKNLEEAIDAAALWAALRQEGGIHLVRACKQPFSCVAGCFVAQLAANAGMLPVLVMDPKQAAWHAACMA